MHILFNRSLARALSLMALFLCAHVHAQTLLWGGRPEFGVELEQEKTPDHLGVTNSITYIPSLVFPDGPINRIDLLIMDEREKDLSSGVSETTRVNKLALRLRKNVHFTEDWGMYFRGLLGHYSSSAERFVYGYTDAAFRYEHDFFGFIAGVRVQRSLDGTPGHDLNKFRLGPSFDIGEHHELEFRWVRAWDAHTHARESDATIVEYTYKF
jgi:hypothetical protein